MARGRLFDNIAIGVSYLYDYFEQFMSYLGLKEHLISTLDFQVFFFVIIGFFFSLSMYWFHQYYSMKELKQNYNRFLFSKTNGLDDYNISENTRLSYGIIYLYAILQVILFLSIIGTKEYSLSSFIKNSSILPFFLLCMINIKAMFSLVSRKELLYQSMQQQRAIKWIKGLFRRRLNRVLLLESKEDKLKAIKAENVYLILSVFVSLGLFFCVAQFY